MKNEINLYNGDCLIESDKIKDSSVDLILTDLPYGTMTKLNYKEQVQYRGKDGFKWDIVINTDKIHKLANRILRKNGKMLLFSQQPFTTELITKANANVPHSYNLIWEKDNYGHALLAKKAPLNYYEDICVFSKNKGFPITDLSHPCRQYFKYILEELNITKAHIAKRLGNSSADHVFRIESSQFALCTEKTYNALIDLFNLTNLEKYLTYAEIVELNKAELLKPEYIAREYSVRSTFNLPAGKKHKSNILKYKKERGSVHPTQKPVLLLEDLIKTYSNEGDLVVDLTMGSGSTGVAAKNTNRNFTGIEMDEDYFKIAKDRIDKAGELL